MGNLSSRFAKWKKDIMSESADSEEYHFPDVLEDFGYQFNEEGKLRNIKTGEQFEFKVKEDNHRYNQKHYEALGDVITKHIYKLLEEKYKLRRKTIPVDATEDEPTTFFYASDDALTNPDKLLFLIHGSGAVRAGQWARSLIINDCLDSGTQFPFIEWGIKNKYGIMVANTNVNSVTRNGEDVDIRCSESPEDHTECIWRNFIQKSKAKNIAVVAHSYGGICTLELVMKFFEDFQSRVFALALTDSVHSFGHQDTSEDVIQFYKERARNWASSYDALDTPLETRTDYCPTVSAGTDKHEYTSYSSMKSIFKFFEEKYHEKNSKGSEPLKRSNSGEQSKSIKSDEQSKETVTQEEVPMSQDVSSQDVFDVEMMSQPQDVEISSSEKPDSEKKQEL